VAEFSRVDRFVRAGGIVVQNDLEEPVRLAMAFEECWVDRPLLELGLLNDSGVIED